MENEKIRHVTVHYVIFQIAIIVVGFGWSTVIILKGNLLASAIGIFLILGHSVVAFRSLPGRVPLGFPHRVLVSLVANLLSAFNPAGILMNFTSLYGSNHSVRSSGERIVLWAGLLISVLIFIMANEFLLAWQSRVTTAVSALFATTGIVLGLNSRLRIGTDLARY